MEANRFSATISLIEDNTKLKISLETNPVALDAVGVERAIEILSYRRLSMKPDVTPLPRQGEPIQVRTDPPWSIAPNVHQGGATLSFHYSGFGWVHIEMTKAMLGDVATAIARARSAPSAPSETPQ